MNKFMMNAMQLFLVALMLTFTISGCQKDKSSEACSLTELPSTLNFNVTPKLRVLGSDIPYEELKEALEIKFAGSIRKYYCSGHQSGEFVYNSTFDPWAIEQNLWTGGFFVGKAYGFDFQNSEDYLYPTITLTAVFASGHTFRAQINTLVYKDDIYTDIDYLKEFFYIDVTNSTTWTEVK